MVICGRADTAFRVDLSRAASRWLGCSPHPRRGERRRFRRGNQKGRHLRFLPSWDSRFPLFPNLVQTRDRRPLRNKGTAVGLLYRLFREIFAVHRQRTATQVGESTQARHARVAQFVSTLLRTAPARINGSNCLNSQVPCVTTCSRFERHCHAALCVE